MSNTSVKNAQPVYHAACKDKYRPLHVIELTQLAYSKHFYQRENANLALAQFLILLPPFNFEHIDTTSYVECMGLGRPRRVHMGRHLRGSYTLYVVSPLPLEVPAP